MRKPERSSEPSIEEILASIRSIIAEDGKSPEKSQEQFGEDLSADRSAPSADQTSNHDQVRSFASVESKPAQLQERETPETAEEILELTEDFMVAEPEQGEQQPLAPATPTRSFSDRAAASAPTLPDTPPAAPENVTEAQNLEDFDEVLSNLAAEVDRLATGERARLAEVPQSEERPSESTAAPLSDLIADTPDNTDVSHSSREQSPVGMPPSAEMPAAYAAPPAAALQPEVTSRPMTKPVWSARRTPAGVEAPKAQTTEQRQDPASKHGDVQELPKSTPASGRDRWAEGVQMPVPDTGPEMPLPLGADETLPTPPEESAEMQAAGAVETETDKGAVGTFLTRVFGNTTPSAEHRDAGEDEALRSKAEKLARDTISDFAEEKLNAPAVGNALKADKAFMDEVAESLETALAEAEENDPADLTAEMVEVREDDQGDLPAAKEPLLSQADVIDDIPSIPSAVSDTSEVPQEYSIRDELPLMQSSPPIQLVEQAAVASPPPASIAKDEPTVENSPIAEADLSVQQEVAHSGAEVLPAAVQEDANALDDQDAAPLETPLLSPKGLPSSLEGSIKEMIKPLIIQWLNDNLPRIVEQAVREGLVEGGALPTAETNTKTIA